MLNFIVVLFLLMVISLIGLSLGIINPKIVIRWGTSKERKTVLKVYGSAAIVLFILVLVLSPFSKKDMDKIKANKSNTENLAAENTPIEPEEKQEDQEIKENIEPKELQETKSNVSISNPSITTGNDRFIIKSSPNTPDAVLEIYYKARKNANEYTESDLKEAIKFLNDNYNNYWNDNEKMVKTMYYGQFLKKIKRDKAQEVKFTLKNTDSAIYKLGLNTYDLSHTIYENLYTKDDMAIKLDLETIKKCLDLIPDEYKK